jgi:hypothetical protein
MPTQPKEQHKRGRRSNYSDKIADAICGRIAHGESLRAICAESRNAQQGDGFTLSSLQ